MAIVIALTIPFVKKEHTEWLCQSTRGLQNMIDGAAAHDGMTWRKFPHFLTFSVGNLPVIGGLSVQRSSNTFMWDW